MSDVVRVEMWSGPRNISTAVMRAFENRPDTVVVDEPLYAAYLSRTGIDHPAREAVIAGEFLRAPEAHLRWLCDWLGIPFTARMLSWPAGPRESDGVWAPHWYAAVWSSTGFEPWRPRDTRLSGHDAAVAEACRPIYDALYARRVLV
jgi:hypothetical protein